MKASFFCGETALNDFLLHIQQTYAEGKVGLIVYDDGIDTAHLAENLARFCKVELNEDRLHCDSVLAIIAVGQKESLQKAYTLGIRLQKPVFLIFTNLYSFVDFNLPLFKGYTACSVLYTPFLKQAKEANTDLAASFAFMIAKAGMVEDLALEEAVLKQRALSSSGLLLQYINEAFACCANPQKKYNDFIRLAVRFVSFMEKSQFMQKSTSLQASRFYTQKEKELLPGPVEMFMQYIVSQLNNSFLQADLMKPALQTDFVRRIYHAKRNWPQTNTRRMVQNFRSFFSLTEDLTAVNINRKELYQVNQATLCLLKRAFSIFKQLDAKQFIALTNLNSQKIWPALSCAIDQCDLSLLALMRNLGMLEEIVV